MKKSELIKKYIQEYTALTDKGKTQKLTDNERKEMATLQKVLLDLKKQGMQV